MTRPEHYRSYSAVFPILLREGANGREVLLHLRQNTGYMDGCWMKMKPPVRLWPGSVWRSWVSQWTPPTRNLSTCATGSPGATDAPITISASSFGNTTAHPPSWSRTKTPGSAGSPRRPFRKISVLPWRSCCAPVCGGSLTVRSFMTFRSHQSKKRKSLCLFKR